MKTTKLQSVLCLLICFAMFNRASASGNHITMSLQNCSQPTSNTIQFDVYAVNDGPSTSDLRANSFQIGLNFNTGILQTGATLTASYLKGSTDFPQLNGFNFPVASSTDHIRIVQSVYSNGNKNMPSMTPGKQYRIGTFVLTSSQKWVENATPDFEFQTATAFGKTVCAAITWVGSSRCTTSVTIPGSGTVSAQKYNERTENNSSASLSTTISCRMAKTLSGDMQAINVFPNPSNGRVTVNFSSDASADYHVVLLDVSNRQIVVRDGKAVQGMNMFDMDLSSVAKGVYTLTIQQAENTMQQRVVVE